MGYDGDWDEAIHNMARELYKRVDGGELSLRTARGYVSAAATFATWCKRIGLSLRDVDVNHIVLHTIDEGFKPYAIGLFLSYSGRSDIARDAVRLASRAMKVKRLMRKVAAQRFGVEPVYDGMLKMTIDAMSPREGTAVALIYTTALPTTSIARMKWSDFLKDFRYVVLNSSGLRVAPLPVWSLDTVLAWYKESMGGGFVFESEVHSGKPVVPSTVSRWVRRTLSMFFDGTASLPSVRAAGWARLQTLKRLKWSPSDI